MTAQMLTARVAQRLLALTAAIWHNRATGQPVTRSWSPTTTNLLRTYSSSRP